MSLIGDFLRALAQVFDRRFLWVLIKALGLTIGLLLAVTAGAGWLLAFVPTDLGTWPLVGAVALPTLGLQALGVIGVLIASSFLMIPVAALFVGLFLDEIAEAVEARHYPDLPAAAGQGFLEGLGSAIRFTGVVVGVNILALLIYLISGPLAPFVFIAVNGLLLGREYFEMVAARRLSASDAATLRKANFWRTWLAGIAMATALVVPIMNLIVPVLGVATITHQFHRRWQAQRG